MAAMDFYNAGLDALQDWTTATYQWVLLTAGTVDPDAATVTAVLAGSPNEVTTGAVASYAREAVSTKVRTVDNTSNRVTYGCADPTFGTLEAGATVTAVLLIRVVTDDSDSIPIGITAITPTATDDVDPFQLLVTDGIVAYVDQAA